MGEETRRVAIPVTGMTCAVCAGRVEKALSKVVVVVVTSASVLCGRGRE